MAAEQEHSGAQFNLALCYADGKGVAQNSEEAMYWCQKAAAQGLVDAQFYLGASYHFGTGVQKDYSEAAKWYRQAANQGDVRAMNNLAWMLATSAQADLRNGKEAVMHALKACELTEWKNTGCIDTLAAAYAEAGMFKDAVKSQQKALDNTDHGDAGYDEAHARLELYKAGRPYWE